MSSRDNWQFFSWNNGTNDFVIGVGEGNTTAVSQVSAGTPANFADLANAPQGNCGMHAHGRIWIAESNQLEVTACAVKDHTTWTGGTEFAFDTQGYWPSQQQDRITALASWEDKVVVFGRENVLIYANGGDTANWALVDAIQGIGCVARDSVQPIGNDLVFLSDTGLRSLKRTIQNERFPHEELGNQVRDTLIPYIKGNETNIKSIYSPEEGFYLLLIKDSTETVVFMYDFKQDGAVTLLGTRTPRLDEVKVSIWKGWDATALAHAWDGTLYAGFRDVNDNNYAIVGKYEGFLDDTETYTMKYTSPWYDLTNLLPEAQANYKIPKSAVWSVVGGLGYSPTIRWAYDYSANDTGSSNFTIPDDGGSSVPEWDASSNLAEYNVSEWGYVISEVLSEKKVHLSGQGDTFSITLECVINDNSFALQRMELFLKRGRLAR